MNVQYGSINFRHKLQFLANRTLTVVWSMQLIKEFMYVDCHPELDTVS